MAFYQRMKSKIERCVHHRFAGGAFHITGGVVLCGHIATYKAVCLSGGGGGYGTHLCPDSNRGRCRLIHNFSNGFGVSRGNFVEGIILLREFCKACISLQNKTTAAAWKLIDDSTKKPATSSSAAKKHATSQASDRTQRQGGTQA